MCELPLLAGKHKNVEAFDLVRKNVVLQFPFYFDIAQSEGASKPPIYFYAAWLFPFMHDQLGF